MKPSNKLFLIKSAHTIIWAFFVSVIGFVVYSGFSGNINIFTWIAIALIIFEGLVLLIFGLSCPLTLWARRYSDSPKDNFDIFLPEWLAKHNKVIFTTIFLVGLICVLFRSLS